MGPDRRTRHTPPRKVTERVRVPEQILTDQGTEFKPARGGLSQFTEYRMEFGAQHITASKRRPTTIGKIEASRKAYTKEAHLFEKHWTSIGYYNHTRPHQELNDLTSSAGSPLA
jgi:transposase InsO family protein